MVNNYDFVITTGGIGPTHDGVLRSPRRLIVRLTLTSDITYASLAKSFNQILIHDPETLRRMKSFSKYRKLYEQQTAEQLTAMQRMALFPNRAEILFVNKESWVVSTHPHSPRILSNGQLVVAGNPIRRQTMRLPWNPNTLPTHAHRAYTVFAFTATKRTPITNTNIYRVSILTSHLKQ